MRTVKPISSDSDKSCIAVEFGMMDDDGFDPSNCCFLELLLLVYSTGRSSELEMFSKDSIERSIPSTPEYCAGVLKNNRRRFRVFNTLVDCGKEFSVSCIDMDVCPYSALTTAGGRADTKVFGVDIVFVLFLARVSQTK